MTRSMKQQFSLGRHVTIILSLIRKKTSQSTNWWNPTGSAFGVDPHPPQRKCNCAKPWNPHSICFASFLCFWWKTLPIPSCLKSLIYKKNSRSRNTHLRSRSPPVPSPKANTHSHASTIDDFPHKSEVSTGNTPVGGILSACKNGSESRHTGAHSWSRCGKPSIR